MWLAKGVSLCRLSAFQEEVFTQTESLHPCVWSWETTKRKSTRCYLEIAPFFVFFGVGIRLPSGVTRTRSLKPEVPPRNNRLASVRSPSLSVGLCRPSLPSLCHYVPACRKAVFHQLPVRRVPGWPPNLRGAVRQTGRQQGRKSGCVGVESRSGCDGHQIWERSSPGRVKERGGSV